MEFEVGITIATHVPVEMVDLSNACSCCASADILHMTILYRRSCLALRSTKLVSLLLPETQTIHCSVVSLSFTLNQEVRSLNRIEKSVNTSISNPAFAVFDVDFLFVDFLSLLSFVECFSILYYTSKLDPF
jgi:hypothetical protein